MPLALRAGWTAQELLTTFPADLGEVALVPGTGGIFTVRLDDDVLWDRGEQGGFPELSRLKQLVRDRVAPTAVWATATGRVTEREGQDTVRCRSCGQNDAQGSRLPVHSHTLASAPPSATLRTSAKYGATSSGPEPT